MPPVPYYEDDLVTLFHGDSLEVSEWLSADVLLTDPPYGIAWEIPAYLRRGRSKGQRSKAHTGILNDADTGVRDAALELWGTKPALVFGSVDRPAPDGTRRMLIWQKPADSGLFGQSIWRKDWEPIYVVGDWPRSPALHSSILSTQFGSHRQYAQGIHPHAKPTDVLRKLLAACPSGVVADPFAGSGSTLIAASLLGRRAVGVELDERYCEVAARRLSHQTLDLDWVTA